MKTKTAFKWDEALNWWNSLSFNQQDELAKKHLFSYQVKYITTEIKYVPGSLYAELITEVWKKEMDKKISMTVQDMREVLGSFIAREFLISPNADTSKLIRDMKDCKYNDEAYIKEWYQKFFGSEQK